MSDKKLTLKETIFIREYLKTGNGAQSAIKAGYSKNCAKEIAYEILTKPHIKNMVNEVMSAEADKLGITTSYILLGLKRWADTENEKLAAQSIKSLELLGKHLKIFHDTEIDVTMQHRDVIKQLEELE